LIGTALVIAAIIVLTKSASAEEKHIV